MNRSPMHYRDPRMAPLSKYRLGERVARYKDHPLMQDVLDDKTRVELAAALDFQQQQEMERAQLAAEEQAEAAAAAKRGFFAKLAYRAFDAGVVFLFAQAPDALSDGLDWIVERVERAKKR